MLDFTNVEAAKDSGERKKYLAPGMYELKMSSVEKKVAKTGTISMEIEFECKSSNLDFDKGITKGNFFITPKTLPRLQALHQGIFGQPITKSFTTEDDIIQYFKSLVDRAPYKKMNAGGRIYNNKVYADLSYSSFFMENENDYEEGEFPVNGELFQLHMTSDIKKIESTEVQEGMFSDEDDNPF